jgi:hypothetical protein
MFNEINRKISSGCMRYGNKPRLVTATNELSKETYNKIRSGKLRPISTYLKEAHALPSMT